jgi:chorismate mutase / prephenate dehydratase
VSGPAAPDPRAPDVAEALARVREAIDDVDRRIVALLDERAALALEAFRLKDAVGRPIRDDQREAEVLRLVAEAGQGSMPAAALEAVYRQVIEVTRDLEAHERQRAASDGTAGDDRAQEDPRVPAR